MDQHADNRRKLKWAHLSISLLYNWGKGYFNIIILWQGQWTGTNWGPQFWVKGNLAGVEGAHHLIEGGGKIWVHKRLKGPLKYPFKYLQYSPSHREDLFHLAWPIGLTLGLWFLGHMKVKTHLLQSSGVRSCLQEAAQNCMSRYTFPYMHWVTWLLMPGEIHRPCGSG